MNLQSLYVCVATVSVILAVNLAVFCSSFVTSAHSVRERCCYRGYLSEVSSHNSVLTLSLGLLHDVMHKVVGVLLVGTFSGLLCIQHTGGSRWQLKEVICVGRTAGAEVCLRGPPIYMKLYQIPNGKRVCLKSSMNVNSWGSLDSSAASARR